MPEGPEVESVLRWLKSEIQDLAIVKVAIVYPNLIQNMGATDFETKLLGEHFRFFHRLGKYLVFVLDHYDLIGHLRMEGKFLLLPDEKTLEGLEGKITRHIHARFWLEDGRILVYQDVRKFGRLALYNKVDDWKSLPSFLHVGKDVLDPSLSAKDLYARGAKSKRNIKAFLLDQSVLAGIGNIYADEILFESRISPYTLSQDLNLDDYQRLLEASRTILQEAMAHGGTTIRTFSYGGHAGGYQSKLRIHDQKECPSCHTPLNREVVAGRGTWACPRCQPRPDRETTKEEKYISKHNQS